jgi:4-diphosphocytidyl-2-C-methyl-D-erythritol kinase
MSQEFMSGPARRSLLAPAKINLSLRVRGRLENGYHALESLVAFADIGDRLDIEKGTQTALSLSGPFGDALAAEDNLVLKAHAALADAVGQALPCHISLHKNLPVASGIGGGSADAAAALRGLNDVFDLQISDAALVKIAATLGADVPVCLSPAPAWMCGIGDEITRLPPLPDTDIVLVNPLVPVATAAVFEALAASSDVTEPQTCPTAFSDLAALIDFLQAQGNALSAAAQNLAPAIKDCLAAVSDAGADFAAMSGSGATCFALVAPGQGAGLAARYRAIRPSDWVQAGKLRRGVAA